MCSGLLGGSLGSHMRHGVNVGVARWLETRLFPWSTFLINITGSLAMGLIASWFALQGQYLAGIGVCF